MDSNAKNEGTGADSDSVVGELKVERAKRDALNKQTQELVQANKQTVSALKGFYDGVKETKLKRDEKNKIVKELKERKVILLGEIKLAREKLDEKEAKIESLKQFVSMPLFELQRKIKAFDWKIQTEAHSAKSEKLLSQEIKKLEKQIPKAQELEVIFKEVRNDKMALSDKNLELSTILRAMELLARESGTYHEELMQLYKKADSLKSKLSVSFSRISEARKEADTHHKKFVEISNSLKSQEEREAASIAEEAKKKKEEFLQVKSSELSSKAKEIFDKFKQGKKMSFEELQILQASNLL